VDRESLVSGVNSLGTVALALTGADESLGCILVVQLAMAILSAACAASRGRNPAGWFALGLLFGLLAFIALLVLPNLEKEARERARDKRLVRQMVKHERAEERKLKDAQYRALVEVLGAVAARGRQESVEAAVQPDAEQALAPAPSEGPPPIPDVGRWYYARGKECVGPLTLESMIELRRDNTIQNGTLVWHEGFSSWRRLENVASIARHFRAHQ